MSRKRKQNHLRVPPNLSRGVDLNDLATKRMMSAVGDFAEQMSSKTDMPMQVCAEYTLMMLTEKQFERQCASCLSLHTNYPALSFYHDAAVGTTVLWSACEDCISVRTLNDPEAVKELSEIAETTILAWISGSLEPQGLVVIFAPPQKEEVPDADES